MSKGIVNCGKWAAWKGLAEMDKYLEFSGKLPNNRNAVVMYHAVGETGYERVSTERFRRDISYMSEHYEIVGLEEALKNTTTGPKKIAITFDDALENVYQNAIPILKEVDAPATVFAVADYISDGSTKENNEYMNLTQLKSLVDDNLFTIGNHTKSHPHLGRLAKQSAIEREIVQAKKDLENQLETDINRFSYPYGSYTGHVANVVADTHEMATTTESRLLGGSPERALIPRLDAKYDFSLLRWELSDTSGIVKSAAHRLGVIESVDF